MTTDNNQKPKTWSESVKKTRRNIERTGALTGALLGAASGGSLKARLAKAGIGLIAGNVAGNIVGDPVARVNAARKNLNEYENPREKNVAKQARRGLLVGGLLGSGIYALKAKKPKLAGLIGTGAAAASVGSMTGATGARIYNNVRGGRKKEENAKYSLFNPYAAEFGLGQYFANKASKDIKEVMSSGATQDVIDNVLKRSIKSGEKQMKKRAKVYGRYARKVWNTSPKLRRNVKIAGVAGAGLVGLNALTGLKTVYDIGKGIKNKIMPKKQQNAQYSLFSPYAVEFARNQQTQEQPKKKSLVKKGLKYAAIGGAGLVGLGAAGRYGGAALKYQLANRKYNNALKRHVDGFMSSPRKTMSMKDVQDFGNAYETVYRGGAKGQIKRDTQWVSNLLKRTPKNDDPFAFITID